MNDLIGEALKWAEKGVPVFPCNGDKRPLTENGFYDAVTDPVKVKELFEFFGDAAQMIGGRMGDGLFAVDLDLYKGPHVKEWYNERKADGCLTETRVHQTKNNGLHMLYEGKESPSCIPTSGVEIKGDGSYIIMPGTPGYTVLTPDIPVADASQALTEMLRYSVAARRGSSIAQLEASVLDGSDFHAALAQIAAKLAAQGQNQAELQQHMLTLLDASTAARPGHERHARWRTITSDKGGELSRIASTAYAKFNDDAIVQEAQELMGIAEMPQVDGVFTQLGNYDTLQELLTLELPVDVWPFDNGYWMGEDREVQDQKFSLYPIFAENETVILFADPKTGKTAIALTAAMHMAHGIDFGSLKVTEKCAVLYYALEGARAIELRVESWKLRMREQKKTVDPKAPLYVVNGHANFIKEESRHAEAAKVIAANKYSIANGTGPLKAVYLDTLTKAMAGGDQNSVEDTSHLFELIGLLRSGGVTATIIFVHHKSRQGNARGSTNIEAEPDVLLDISKSGDVVQMKIAKARSIEDGAKFHFQLEGVELGMTTQGHPLTGVFVSPMEQEGEPLEDMAAVQLLGQRRKLIIQLGANPTTAQVVSAWHAAGLIEGGNKVRGKAAPPSLTSALVREALAKVADDAGGTIYGDHIIRPKKAPNGDVEGFSVGDATFT